MRGAIVLIVAVVVLGYIGVKAGTMVKAKSDLTDRVNYRLDFVDETSLVSVKQDIVRDAEKLGIVLVPDNIRVTYADTEQRTLAQKIVGARIAQFVNKQISITVHYVVHILSIPFNQEISAHKIKQVQVQQAAPNPVNVPPLDTGE
jgi:hypothetical protein